MTRATPPDLHPKFARWLERNPGGSFKDFYLDGIDRALSGEKEHATLGPRLKPGSISQAARIVEQLTALGLIRDDVVVDYGCGTLRVGRMLIEYLAPQRYVGLDIDRRILEVAQALLPKDLCAEKQPSLEVITPETVVLAAQRRPRWLYSIFVAHHVPPDLIDSYFHNIAQILGQYGTAVISARISERSEPISVRSWSYSLEDLTQRCARQNLAIVKWLDCFDTLGAHRFLCLRSRPAGV